MAIVTWDDLVNEAFVDANVIQPGEVLTATLLADGEARLNQLLSSLSTEGLTAYQLLMTSYPLQSAVTNYTFGVGGTFNTSTRAQKVTSWQASYNDMREGGPVLSMEQLGIAAAAYQKQLAELALQSAIAGLLPAGVPSSLVTPVPKFLAADTSFPLINIRVWPPPAVTAGSVELAYFTAIAQIANFTLPMPTMPEGWQDMLHFQLAVRIYHLYPRAGGMPVDLAANAKNSKEAVVTQNLPTNSPTAAAPQQ